MNNIKEFMDTVGKELSEANSYAQMKRIMDKSGLEYLGSGSARIVYKLDEDSVVKVAKNQFGLHQNATETDFYIQQEFEDFLTKTKDFDDENYRFTIAEYATKIKSQKELFTKINDIYGVSGDDFSSFIENLDRVMRFNSSPGYKKLDEINEKYPDNELLNNIQRICQETDILPGDFDRHSSWGMVREDGKEKLAIKDYGLNLENHKMFVLKKDSTPQPRRGPYMM